MRLVVRHIVHHEGLSWMIDIQRRRTAIPLKTNARNCSTRKQGSSWSMKRPLRICLPSHHSALTGKTQRMTIHKSKSCTGALVLTCLPEDFLLTRFYSYEVQVSQKARGTGLGRLLMRSLETFARAYGLPKVMLTVFEGERGIWLDIRVKAETLLLHSQRTYKLELSTSGSTTRATRSVLPTMNMTPTTRSQTILSLVEVCVRDLAETIKRRNRRNSFERKSHYARSAKRTRPVPPI